MPLTLYLPKNHELYGKLAESLTPSDASRAAVAEPQGQGKGKGQATGTGKGKDKGNDAKLRTCIRVWEKRLSVELWK